MPSQDETVTQEDVWEILARVRKQGWRCAMQELEFEEPVLAGFSLAQSYKLDEKLRSMWAPPPVLVMVQNEMMISQIVNVKAMREAARKLWSDFLPAFDQEIQK